MSENQVPEGYMEDTQGRLVPVALVGDYDKAKDALVKELAAAGMELQEHMRAYKARVMGDVEALIQLAGERYSVKIGGKKGNVSLVSFDGGLKIVRAVADNIIFDERLQVARELVEECLREWTEGSREELQALISEAFQTDREGKVNTARILSLRKLQIADDRWQSAMQAISDSIQAVGTSTYFRLYRRDSSGRYQAISLDLATL